MDLSVLIPLLQQLGPWGMAAALLILWLRSRQTPQPTPGPTPTPNPLPLLPAPLTPVEPSNTPILDALLKLLKLKLTRQAASVGTTRDTDIDEDTATELLKMLAKK